MGAMSVQDGARWSRRTHARVLRIVSGCVLSVCMVACAAAATAQDRARALVLLARADACLAGDETPACPPDRLDVVRMRLELESAASAIRGDVDVEVMLQIAAASYDIALLEGSEEAIDEASDASGAPPVMAWVPGEAVNAPGEAAAGQGARALPRGDSDLAARPVDRQAAGNPVPGERRQRAVVVVAPVDEPAQTDATCELWTVPVAEPRVTSRFGPRRDPITGRAGRMHRGIDYGHPTGTPTYATASGRVLLAGWCDRGTGNCVVIDHGNGWRSQYFHLSRVTVRAGAEVRQGEEVGLIGSTGRSTGPHLHFQVGQNGQAIDPERLFDRPVGDPPR